jgi:class 3 adenylate cyclase
VCTPVNASGAAMSGAGWPSTWARIGAMAAADEVLASRTVRDLSAGSGLQFDSVGAQQLKGLAEAVEVFRVRTPVRA